jgi:AmpD protein|tara:strand:+ start:54461 stop:54967 length:507 start_codon:yes stop_codon:yes gene_type:complete
VPSPNFNQRPATAALSLLVIHNISLPPGEFGGTHICDFFTNCLDADAHPYFREIVDLRVSAHLLIRRDGDVVQFVSFHDRAWHAGQSCFDGAENCNDFSLGIELEGSDDKPYTDQQYRCLAALVRVLLAHYPGLSKQRIVGHSDIAPGRKTDPGPCFDWRRLSAALEA